MRQESDVPSGISGPHVRSIKKDLLQHHLRTNPANAFQGLISDEHVLIGSGVKMIIVDGVRIES